MNLTAAGRRDLYADQAWRRACAPRPARAVAFRCSRRRSAADVLLDTLLSPWRGTALVLLRVVRVGISVGDRADFSLARAAALAGVLALAAHLQGIL